MRTITFATALFMAGSSVAVASHPQRYDPERLPRLAHQLEAAAAHVYHEAKAARHHYDRGESLALKRLRKLEAEARHFHRQVEKRYPDPYHTERDYRDLREAYISAAQALPALHAVAHVERDFRDVSRLVASLDGYFGYYAYGRGADRSRPHFWLRYDSRAPSWLVDLWWKP